MVSAWHSSKSRPAFLEQTGVLTSVGFIKCSTSSVGQFWQIFCSPASDFYTQKCGDNQKQESVIALYELKIAQTTSDGKLEYFKDYPKSHPPSYQPKNAFWLISWVLKDLQTPSLFKSPPALPFPSVSS